VVYEADPKFYSNTRHHYGSRLAFDHDGHLLISIGERGAMHDAQEPKKPNGKIHRVWPDGSIPEDNPYADGKDGLPSVYCYGNRNPQGLAVHPETGEIWETEHGPMGGDEVNLIEAGKNYGWPIASYGIDYNGSIITENLEVAGTQQPVHYWVPSIAVCGTRFCTGDAFPRWHHNLLVGGLGHEELRRLVIADGRVIHQELLLKNAGRVRDVACDPSGNVYVVLNNPDIVIKLTNQGRALRQ
jgi:glucose/arabinose dehydrogenase